MQIIALSESATALLRECYLHRVDVTDANRSAYHELEAAGLVMPMGSFTKEITYWLTDEAWNRRDSACVKAAG